MRIFAGPNGSGKSTIFNRIDKSYDIGTYINPDLIEQELIQTSRLNLAQFGIDRLDSSAFKDYLAKSTLLEKARDLGFKIELDYSSNYITTPESTTYSYEAALLAEFLRLELINRRRKLTFETVMSHPSKLQLMDISRESGYKNYLYFICTSSPKINLDRVNLRVRQGGHAVSEEKVEDRYYKCLSLLKDAVRKTYRTFIWDNSRKEPRLLLEIFEGKQLTYHTDDLPYWIVKYLDIKG